MSSLINHCLSDLNCNWNDDLKNQNIDNWNKWIQAMVYVLNNTWYLKKKCIHVVDKLTNTCVYMC